MNQADPVGPRIADTRAAEHALLARVFEHLAPPPPLTVREWAERYRVMSSEETPLPGRYSAAVTPVIGDVLDFLADPKVRMLVVQKAAQVGYTSGLVCNVLGYFVHWRPSVQVVVFPRDQAAKDFAAEKLDPMIRATPALAERINLRSRALGNSQTRKHYPGGLLKLVGSLSPSGVKSTSARVVVIEEPDDVTEDLKGQGSAIRLAQERGKWFDDGLVLIGGTPTAKGASAVEAMMAQTDQRRCYVGCHHCGEAHALDWSNVDIPAREQGEPHPVYGLRDWERAVYVCPHCGGIWSDSERAANIQQRRRWEATAEGDGTVIGVYLSELYATGAASRLPLLARKYLEADAALQAGNAALMVAFKNNTLGEVWEYKGELPEVDELAARGEPYAEWTCPAGGLVPIMNVDIQHDRLAVTVWVVGRGEEMWLAYWGELYGQTMVAHAGAWVELEALLGRTVRHDSGAQLRIAAVGIDCSDGQTSDAGYSFVRAHHRSGRPVRALKGAADATGRQEIWRPPKPIDPGNRSTKAARHGVQVDIIGTARAKDLLLGYATETGRLRLTGSGPGRMHWYASVRADFHEQLLSEIKVPSARNPSLRVWKRLLDRRNEVLDCTVGCVYMVRHLRLHLRKPSEWDAAELRVVQLGLFHAPAADDAAAVATPSDAGQAPPPAPAPAPKPPAPAPAARAPQTGPPPGAGGFGSDDWYSRL